MATGLRIWDAAGNLMLDTNDRVSQGLGVVTIPANSTGSVTVPATGGYNDIWFQFSPSTTAGIYSRMPDITVAGDLISWSFASGGTAPTYVGGTLRYGRY